MEEKEKERLIKHILKRKDGLPTGFSRRELTFEITSEDFLSFAKSDLKLKAKRSPVNALSNAKRAIDSQIDSILFIIGYLKQAKKEHWSFPKKIEFINYLGIISPNILKRINRARNLLEHEYKYPSKEEVEDAIDVTELFLNATKKIINMGIACEIDVSTNRGLIKKGGRTGRLSCIYLNYNNEKRLFKVELLWQPEMVMKDGNYVIKDISSVKEEFTINGNDSIFIPLLKKCIEFVETSY